MSSTNNMPLSGDPHTNAVMKEIEKKTEIKVAQLMQPVSKGNAVEKLAFVATQGNSFGNALMNTMNEGAKEFEEKVGRPMSYSEMRMMYG